MCVCAHSLQTVCTDKNISVGIEGLPPLSGCVPVVFASAGGRERVNGIIRDLI